MLEEEESKDQADKAESACISINTPKGRASEEKKNKEDSSNKVQSSARRKADGIA